MTGFEEAVRSSDDLRDGLRTGLDALLPADKNRLMVTHSRRLRGSVDIDGHLRSKHPQSPRWDYAVGYQAVEDETSTEKVYWVEVHSATEGEVSAVLEKLRWLQEWISKNAPRLSKMEGEFVWIASGKTSISPTSPKRRLMAKAGLKLVGGKLKIG
jgi:hypothetical protein